MNDKQLGCLIVILVSVIGWIGIYYSIKLFGWFIFRVLI